MWAIMAVVAVTAWLGTRRLMPVPGRLQAALELMIEGLQSFFASILGRARARQFLPLLASLFLLIIASNYAGLLPGAGHLRWLETPTSNWGTTAGLAIVAFVATTGYGLVVRRLGYFRRFVEPRALAPVMIPLGIIEELTRPFSLSLRLTANVFAGETLVQTLLSVFPYGLPVVPMLLEAFFGFIQALIFSFLTAIYIHMAIEE